MRTITPAERRCPPLAVLVLIALLLLVRPVTGAGAQLPGGLSPTGPSRRAELRLDALSATVDALHLGGGLGFPVGTYARVVGLLGGGVARAPGPPGADDDTGVSARADALIRFHFDPMRQSRWGPYASGGVSIRSDFEECCRGSLALLLGVEGSRASGTTWAFELGFGGGVRAAVVLRGGGGRWR